MNENGGEHAYWWITLYMNFGDAKYIDHVRGIRNNNNSNGLNILLLYLIIEVMLLSPKT